MSILGALKQMKQQTGSLDELAGLPQTMIMQMVQSGQIPKEQLGPILNRKAELADMKARVQATNKGDMAPMSIMEQLMAKNAQAEQPQQMEDMGVAQLPIREDMYNERRMAGGGIVAFQNNPDQPVDENMPTTDESNPYLERSRAVAGFGRNLGQAFTDPRNYNPFSVYQRAIGQPFAAAANRFINETPEQQAERFRRASQARESIGKRMSGVPTTAEEVKRLAPAEKIVGSEQALYDAERLAKESKRTALPTVGPQGQVIAPDAGTKAQKVAAAGANVAAQESGTSAVDEYAKDSINNKVKTPLKRDRKPNTCDCSKRDLALWVAHLHMPLLILVKVQLAPPKATQKILKAIRAEERERAKALGCFGYGERKTWDYQETLRRCC